jgi:hypothetical protein
MNFWELFLKSSAQNKYNFNEFLMNFWELFLKSSAQNKYNFWELFLKSSLV